MKRHLMTLILSGFVGSLVLAGNAEACHKKKCRLCTAPTCAVVEPAALPPAGPGLRAAPVRPRPRSAVAAFLLQGHEARPSQEGCAGRPRVCETVATRPVAYSAPVSYRSSPHASPQASAQH